MPKSHKTRAIPFNIGEKLAVQQLITKLGVKKSEISYVKEPCTDFVEVTVKCPDSKTRKEVFHKLKSLKLKGTAAEKKEKVEPVEMDEFEEMGVRALEHLIKEAADHIDLTHKNVDHEENSPLSDSEYRTLSKDLSLSVKEYSRVKPVVEAWIDEADFSDPIFEPVFSENPCTPRDHDLLQ